MSCAAREWEIRIRDVQREQAGFVEVPGARLYTVLNGVQRPIGCVLLPLSGIENVLV